ncbi:hypothetical protein N8739_00615 [Luminiphilus sp.]|nr:hypothetical protein [Luminiphilus sp.]
MEELTQKALKNSFPVALIVAAIAVVVQGTDLHYWRYGVALPLVVAAFVMWWLDRDKKHKFELGDRFAVWIAEDGTRHEHYCKACAHKNIASPLVENLDGNWECSGCKTVTLQE